MLRNDEIGINHLSGLNLCVDNSSDKQTSYYHNYYNIHCIIMLSRFILYPYVCACVCVCVCVCVCIIDGL